MEPSEPDQNKPSTDTSSETVGVGSSLELGNVKKILSVKMEQPGMHYTSVKPLGNGSFGEVNSALDTLLGREVAIKSLKKRFREEEEVVDRFLKEARGTSQLEHPTPAIASSAAWTRTVFWPPRGLPYNCWKRSPEARRCRA